MVMTLENKSEIAGAPSAVALSGQGPTWAEQHFQKWNRQTCIGGDQARRLWDIVKKIVDTGVIVDVIANLGQ